MRKKCVKMGKMQDSVQIKSIVLSSVKLLCRTQWRGNPKHSLTDLQYAKLLDNPDCHQRSQSRTEG